MRYILLFILLPFFTFSQTWVENMLDQNVNFYETQNTFNEFWDNKTVEKGKGWKQFKRWENFIKPRVYPTGNLQPHILFEEYSKLNDYSNLSMYPNNTWSQVGPDDVPLQSNGGKRGIGRVNTISFHPSDPNIIYIGAPAGGFWKSNNNGQTWSTSTDFLTNLGVSDIAIDPVNPDIIYIITGDRDAGDTYSYGLLKSNDGGNTFNLTGLSFNITNYYRGNRVLIDPVNTNIIIVSTSNGIYRSADGGSTFSLTLSGINMTDIEFHPTNNNVIYGASKGNTSIYKSIDNGQNWFQSGTGLPATNSVVRACVAVTPDNPQVVYALFGNNNNGFYGVYKSVDEGSNWTLQSDSPNLLGWSSTGSDSDGQAWYDLAFAVSPINENILFVGGVNTWRSTDGGISWNLNTHWTGSGGADYKHADVHMLKYNPLNNHIYSGNDGGLYFSTDEVDWTDISDGLHITQFYSLGVSQTVQEKVITGSQDNGTFLKTNLNWDAVIGGDGMECIIDYTNSNVMYGALYYGDIRKSTNGGNSFSTISTGNGAWETPYELDKNNPNVIYIGYDELVKSIDGGNSWNQITSNQTNGNRIDEIGLSKSDPDRIYFSDGSDMFRTIDGGSNWTKIDNNGLPNLSISYILVNPNDEDIVWVTLSGYSSNEKVYKSYNGGNSWINISYSLPNVPVNCIELDNGNTLERVYIGTDLGVWTIDSTTSSWDPFNQNSLPNVIVNELEMQYQSNTLYAATYGRGLWSINLDITSPPSANFSYTDSVFCMIPADVDFINNSFYSTSYYWDFGDGNTSTLANPTHVYNSFGTFTVSLIAIGPLGTDSIVKQQIISIDPNNPCIITLPPNGNGGNLTMCSGTLYDVGGPNGGYYANSYSTITIAPPGSNQIDLNFTFFDVESPSSGSSTCDYDYLEIFDGPNTSSPSLGQYCNTLTGSPGILTTSSGAVTILLYSDPGVEESGFAMDWNCSFSSAPPVTSFSYSDSISCNQTIYFSDLSTNGPTSWNWDFGDGNSSTLQNPIHTYLNSGEYTVKLVTSNAFGIDSVIVYDAINILDLNLQAFGDSSCVSSSFILNATSNSGTVSWYSDPTLQILLDTGLVLTTPVLNNTTSYYAQSVFEFGSSFGGEPDNTFGNGGYFNGNQHLIFDSYSNLVIKSAVFYADNPNTITFELRDNNGNVLDDTTHNVVQGQQQLQLNFEVPIGNDLQLGISNGNSGLYRNSNGASYPYNIGSMMSITGSSATSSSGYYYFYYDIEIEKPACKSNIVEVVAKVDTITQNTSTIVSCGSYLWPIDSNVYSSSGVYTDTVLSTSGCVIAEILNLTISNNLIISSDSISSCSSFTWLENGVTYDSSGTYYVNTVDSNGCTLTNVLSLTIGNTITNSQTVDICFGDNYIVGSNIYNSPGYYTDYLTTNGGCDSIVYTNLSVSPLNNFSQNLILCEGDSISVGNSTYFSEGNYTDTITSDNSCDSIVNTSISINSLDFNIILNFDSLEIVSYSGNPNTYLWSTGETSNPIFPINGGIYWCIVTDVNDCISDTVYFNYDLNFILNDLSESLNIFPNPSSGIINIQFTNNTNTTIKITNILGENIFDNQILDYGYIDYQVDLSNNSSGVYLVELRNKYGTIYNKIVLE